MAIKLARTTGKKNKSKKNRKYERNKVWCAAYKKRGQRVKNKLVRLAKHLKRHPNDGCAVANKERLRALL